MTVRRALGQCVIQEAHNIPCSENNQRVSDVAKGEKHHAKTGPYSIVNATCCPVAPVDELAEPVVVESPPVPMQRWHRKSARV